MTSVASNEFSRFIIYTTLIGSCQIFEISASGPNTYGDLKRLESSRCRHFGHEIHMKIWNPFQPRCFMVSTTNISHIKNIYIYIYYHHILNGMSWPKSQHGAMSCPSLMRWWPSCRSPRSPPAADPYRSARRVWWSHPNPMNIYTHTIVLYNLTTMCYIYNI